MGGRVQHHAPSCHVLVIMLAALFMSSSYALSSSLHRTRRDANNAVLAANADIDANAHEAAVHVHGEPGDGIPPTGPGGKNVPTPATQETNEDHVSPMPATPLAFFPESCSSNASLAARECCPSVNGVICNGRGTCSLKLGNQTGQCNAESYASIFWFADYFDKACTCEGHYWGAACEECAPGWGGADCSEAQVLLVRRNATNLTPTEQDEVIAAFKAVKTMIHPYWPNSRISVFDWFAAFHAWAKKPEDAEPRFPEPQPIDYAHEGPGLLTWHRSLSWKLERFMQQAINNPTFTIPYWDWDPTSPVLTWMGGNSSVPDGCWLMPFDCKCSQLPSSPFGNWTEVDTWGKQMAVVSRAYGCMGQSMFAMSDLVSILTSSYYSYVWRNIRVPHASAHMWCGGSMMTQAPPSDPLFYLVHSFVDYLLEAWIRQAITKDMYCLANMQPANIADTHVGHARDQCTAPFFPLTRQRDWFVPSYSLGYTFDILLAADPVLVTTDIDVPTNCTGAAINPWIAANNDLHSPSATHHTTTAVKTTAEVALEAKIAEHAAVHHAHRAARLAHEAQLKADKLAAKQASSAASKKSHTHSSSSSKHTAAAAKVTH